MINKNSLAGIKSAEFLFVDTIAVFAIVSNEKAYISNESPFLQMRAKKNGISINVTSESGGSIYKHVATIRFCRSALSELETLLLRQIKTRGCIIRYEDQDSLLKILGTREYPLFGELIDIPGVNASDFVGYELSLSCLSTHPQLLYYRPSQD